jgi:hypothetical protein
MNEKRLDVDPKQKSRENLVLLLLGSAHRPLSMLHLEKEAFLLWKFHPGIKGFVNFIKHYRGPFSKELQKTVISPIYCVGCWTYTYHPEPDRLTGGHIRMKQKGEEEYRRLVSKMRGDPELEELLSAISMVRDLYDTLAPEELLLMVYDTYPEYIEKSDVYSEIDRKRRPISLSLFERGVIDDQRLQSLLSKGER